MDPISGFGTDQNYPYVDNIIFSWRFEYITGNNVYVLVTNYFFQKYIYFHSDGNLQTEPD
jgi:hypothetical protein